MMLGERREAYIRAFPQWPASWPLLVQEHGQDVLYATWLLGNDYRNKTRLYGAYPPGYLDRVMALFPDAGNSVLHAFSGSLPSSKSYDRCDLRRDAEFKMDILELCQLQWRWRLVLADPPYSEVDAVKYGTPMIDRKKVTSALSKVVHPGGYLVWLDTCWPMFRKDQWRTVGRITIIRSTNHRVRLVSIFERQPTVPGDK